MFSDSQLLKLAEQYEEPLVQGFADRTGYYVRDFTRPASEGIVWEGPLDGKQEYLKRLKIERMRLAARRAGLEGDAARAEEGGGARGVTDAVARLFVSLFAAFLVVAVGGIALALLDVAVRGLGRGPWCIG